MRIGVLTLPFNNNYGGYLQAFALMMVLDKMGHRPNLIMRRHDKHKVTFIYRMKYFVKGLTKTLLRFRPYPIIYDAESDFRKRGANMLPFVSKYIQPQTPYLYSTNDLEKYCEGKFDAYVVGSDQVWRAIYVPDIRNYFLDFTKGWNVRRISYAASFGTDKPEYTLTEIADCRNLIEYFTKVSVREKSGIKIFNSFGWKSKRPSLVLDPTLLLDESDYNTLLRQCISKSQGKIFYYVLDLNKEVLSILNRVSEELHLPFIGLSDIQRGEELLPSIEYWLASIQQSEFVVTDSFHGMVFSIIFKKPFIVCGNENRGADRFHSLLDLLGLSDRLNCGIDNLDEVLNKQIDWKKIDGRISELKSESLFFLKDALK